MLSSEKYEMMIALKPLLPDDVRKNVHKDIISTVEELGGSLDNTDVWGKRYLAYKIQGHSEGYYIVYQMSIPSHSIAEFRRRMELRQEVLRYILIKIEREEELGVSLKKKDFSEEGQVEFPDEIIS